MEQHPVPQNVTTFQFRLIGDMTLKQFGYLAGGFILGYIFYKLPLPFFITWPLAFVGGLLGIGFAFVPIEERPMDVWVLSFFKSIYSPTQYVWSKEEKKVVTAPIVSPPPTQPPVAPTPTIVANTPSLGDAVARLFSSHSAQQQPPVQPPARKELQMDMSMPPIVKREAEVEEKVKEIKEEIATHTDESTRIVELQKQLSELLAQRDEMEKEIVSLRKQTPQSETTSATATQTHKPNVNVITPDQAIKVGLIRLTTFPNVVTGIVKDSDRNFLPGVLVTVKDQAGVPLRALKTNRLGQFAASTPLPNGVYFIEIEDPRKRYLFDRAQVTLNNSIVPAIEVVAKGQKEIVREKLAKELFGNAT